jgi:phospho-N-acetylmuramoyl-pentapeptide-transferase
MLYYLSQVLTAVFSPFNMVHYVSFRAIAALLTAFGASLLFGNSFIAFAKRLFRVGTREYVPETHKGKDNMPSMGGVFIVGTVLVSILLWCNLSVAYVWTFMVCLLGFGGLGFWDDWCKIVHRKGISARSKFIVQWGCAFLVSVMLFLDPSTQPTLVVPFLKGLQPYIGYFYIPWVMFILVACSNAVNLTDGLDGLAIGSLMPNLVVFSIFCYLAGHMNLAMYLHIPFVASAEISVIGGALIGAALGFLWFNAYPAQIFMGDVGALSLGAVLGFMAIVSKQELILPLAGGIFVAETLSVIVQIFSVKYFGRRVFKMAPIHHHFELLGWQEAKITVRFTIVSIVLSLLALITLKMR